MNWHYEVLETQKPKPEPEPLAIAQELLAGNAVRLNVPDGEEPKACCTAVREAIHHLVEGGDVFRAESKGGDVIHFWMER